MSAVLTPPIATTKDLVALGKLMLKQRHVKAAKGVDVWLANPFPLRIMKLMFAVQLLHFDAKGFEISGEA